MVLRDDPRADPRMLSAMAPYGLDVPPPPAGVDQDSLIEALLAFTLAAESDFESVFDALFAPLPPVAGVTSRTEVIKGVDGNSIDLHIHRPTSVRGRLPCIVHTHGGGMVILKASGRNYVRWRDELAAAGTVVVGVAFRNGGGLLGAHPFPAGLNDCASAVRWVYGQREELGISAVVVSGESGGGNLALATALKASQEGWVDRIAGIYAQCPYISNAYGDPPPALPSLFENDDYFLNVSMMGAMAKVYDPDGANATNPLAWPYHATKSDLKGLPAHVISVNQLDPLRDEGLVYFAKLLNAGVIAGSRTVNGTCHAGDCLFREAMPDVYLATIRDIAGFAKSL
jgi:acetyl esterase/lipase